LGKFGGPDDTLPRKWTFVFEVSSDGAIRACEIADLEERFLRAIDFGLSTPCSLIGYVGSWSRTRRLAEAAAAARGPRRWRRLKGKISTSASVLACQPLLSLLTRIWIQIFCSAFKFD
jgi:hypothetical protein